MALSPSPASPTTSNSLLHLQQRHDPLADHGVVVEHHHPDRSLGLPLIAGTSTRTVGAPARRALDDEQCRRSRPPAPSCRPARAPPGRCRGAGRAGPLPSSATDRRHRARRQDAGARRSGWRGRGGRRWPPPPGPCAAGSPPPAASSGRGAPVTSSSTTGSPEAPPTSVSRAAGRPRSSVCGRSTQTDRRASSRLSLTMSPGRVQVAVAWWPGLPSRAPARRHSSCTEVATNAWARVSWMSRAMRARSAITACRPGPRRARRRRRWTRASSRPSPSAEEQREPEQERGSG